MSRREDEDPEVQDIPLEFFHFMSMLGGGGPIPLPGPQGCNHGARSRALGVNKKLPDYIMVAAIDFGTTYSGYAFSTKDKKQDIKMNKNWGAEFGCTSYKTPTTVLVDPQKKFCSFGYDAQQQYAELLENEDQQYYYFERFKMTLHKTKDLGKSTTVCATNGKSMPALEIFGMALEYLKSHLLDAVNKSLEGTIDEKMIRWVITVPAIWSDASKQFMREAALKGGLITELDSGQLFIALEPESASLYVRKMDIGHESPDRKIKCGTKYLVIDAGGGTLDVTAHELLPDGKIKELHFATGGDFGGSRVDEQFTRLLGDICGQKFIETFKKKSASQWLQLITDFEKRKKSCKKNKSDGLNVSIPWSFASKLSESKRKDITKVIKDYKAEGVTFVNGMLRFNGNITTSLFKPVTDGIVGHIRDLLKKPKLKDIEYLFCVGGFNDSKFLQEVLQEAFGTSLKIILPEEASLAVLKGAILFGHEPDIINSRISARTYGVSSMSDFLPFIHPPSQMVYVQGRPMCNNFFRKFVHKGEDVPLGFAKTIEFRPLFADEDKACVGIHSSEREDSMCVTDRGVDHLGEISVEWPGIGLDRKIEITMTFGGTEIEVEAVSYPGENRADTKITFLAE